MRQRERTVNRNRGLTRMYWRRHCRSQPEGDSDSTAQLLLVPQPETTLSNNRERTGSAAE